MGTSSSSWDALHELTGRTNQDEHLEEALELIEAVEAGAVTRAHLDELEAALSIHLDGLDVRCVLTPLALDPDEQRALLGALADPFAPHDILTLDVTHGFRHLGLLAVQGAWFLGQARQVHIDQIYYGMFSPETSRAIQLEDASELMRWTEALTIFRRTGNLGPLPGLFRADHPEVATPLAALHYTININAFERAAHSAHQARAALRKMAGEEDSLAGYIAKELASELAKLFAGEHVADWQRRLARRALETGDFMRAVILLYESIVSDAIADPEHRTHRNRRVHAGKEFGRKGSPAQEYFEEDVLWTFLTLRFIRNDIAHGSNPDDEPAHKTNVRKRLEALRDGEALARFLEACFEELAEPARRLRQDPPF